MYTVEKGSSCILWKRGSHLILGSPCVCPSVCPLSSRKYRGPMMVLWVYVVFIGSEHVGTLCFSQRHASWGDIIYSLY